LSSSHRKAQSEAVHPKRCIRYWAALTLPEVAG
jgi:hypothetical protein